MSQENVEIVRSLAHALQRGDSAPTPHAAMNSPSAAGLQAEPFPNRGACHAAVREHGALEYRECVADDVKRGKLTSLPQSVKLKPGETIVFAWITYKSRAHRDRVNAQVMKDPRLADMMDPKTSRSTPSE